jgi:hypothetical protein
MNRLALLSKDGYQSGRIDTPDAATFIAALKR